MSLEALRQALRVADASAAALLDADEVAGWTEGSLAALAALGLLRKAPPAEFIACDGCEEQCLEKVEFVGVGDGTRALIICSRRDDMGPIEVPLERLRRWTVDLGALADALAPCVGKAEQAEEVIRGRMWWLGRVPVGEARGDVFLARGVRWGDAEDVLAQSKALRGTSLPVVLTLSETPAREVFGGQTGVVSLPRVLSIESGRLVVDQHAITQAARAAAVEVPVADYVFRWDGDGWGAVFEGVRSHHSDTVGMRYLHRLLTHPGRDFRALELARLVDGTPTVDTSRAEATRRQALDEDRLEETDLTDAGEIMDDDYRRDVKERLRALEEDIASARQREDVAAEEQLEQQKEELLRFTAGALGLSGRKRKANDPHEKARQRARANIRRALDAIGKKNPALQAHLQKAVKTGYVISYEPDRHITWITD